MKKSQIAGFLAVTSLITATLTSCSPTDVQAFLALMNGKPQQIESRSEEPIPCLYGPGPAPIMQKIKPIDNG